MKQIPYLHRQNLHNEQVNLAYYTIGDSPDIIFCIHGITRNSKDFSFLSAELSKDYTVICVDIFGRGNSDWLKNKKDYNYHTYYHSIINLAQHLGLKKISIIGTSMGGIIAMYLAAYQASLVDKIILNDVGPQIDLSALKRLAFHMKKFPKFTNKSAALDYLKIFLSPLHLKSDQGLLHMVENSLKAGDDGDYYLNYDPNIGEKFAEDIKSMKDDMNLWHVWRKINQPTLILRGEKSNVLTSNIAKKMIRNNVETIEYPGVGHVPSLLEEKQISDIVTWLNKY